MTKQKQLFTFTRGQLEKIIRTSIQATETYQKVHGKTPESAMNEIVDQLLGMLEVEKDAWMAGEGELELQSGAMVDKSLILLATEAAMLSCKNELRDAKEQVTVLKSLIDSKNKAIQEAERDIAKADKHWAECADQVQTLQKKVEELNAKATVGKIQK